jgi:signal transduction histidine kinase
MLRAFVIVSLAYAFAALIILVIRTSVYGHKSDYAEAQGNIGKGVIYAFGQGMMPWAKESAAKHLPTFIAGIFYHAGIFAAGLFLITLLFEFSLSPALTQILRIGLTIGLACGLGLLTKRVSLPYMRFISCPDDYLSNLLVNIFIAAALAVTFVAGWQTILFWAAIALSLYIPLGKIRHCLFFFYTRILFGAFFGRRGVLPNRVSGSDQ